MCAFVGEEYIKSLTANPELVDRLACVSDEGVCVCLFSFYKINWLQMACSTILHPVCQGAGISLEYKQSGPYYHFGSLTFWQLKSKKEIL